jgi:hypothetical protein
MTLQVTSTETIDSRWSWLCKIGGVAALITGMLLLIGMISLIATYMGILASVFLFVGDLTVGIHSNTITILFGVGYVLLTTWLFLIAQSLVRLGRVS